MVARRLWRVKPDSALLGDPTPVGRPLALPRSASSYDLLPWVFADFLYDAPHQWLGADPRRHHGGAQRDRMDGDPRAPVLLTGAQKNATSTLAMV
jgi:hypothetical protein